MIFLPLIAQVTPTWAGTGELLIAFGQVEEEQPTLEGSVERRMVYRKTKHREYTTNGAIWDQAKFDVPATYRLVEVRSQMNMPSTKMGVHEEDYLKEGAWTTTTT